jgi:glucosyl-3-phosphoglycerate phosphatase
VHDLLIIRHGESEWNLARRWQGWKDAPLTELGVQQARERAASLAGSGFQPVVVHSSDLGRARQTAQIIAAALDAPARPDPGFRERSGGDWEGHTAAEIDQLWPGMRDAWRRGEIHCPPGGETDDVVLERFDAAVANVIGSGVPALIVTHGGALRLVATRAGVAIDELMPNLGGYWFAYDGDGLTDPERIAALDVPTDVPATE